MAKMSKAVARKRLLEARTKILKVVNECMETSPRDNNDLFKMAGQLLAIRKRLK